MKVSFDLFFSFWVMHLGSTLSSTVSDNFSIEAQMKCVQALICSHSNLQVQWMRIKRVSSGFMVLAWVSGCIVVNHWDGNKKYSASYSQPDTSIWAQKLSLFMKVQFRRRETEGKRKRQAAQAQWQTLQITFFVFRRWEGPASCQLFTCQVCHTLKFSFFHLSHLF